MRSLLVTSVRPVAAVLASLLVVSPADARTVRCESQDYRYRYCAVPTYGDVHLQNELSRSACHYGRSWGYDHRGVWVDRGCRASFGVDEGSRGRYSSYDYYDRDHRNDGGSKAGAAVAGVALGAAIAAAIVASKNKNRQDRDVVPNWLVGRFEGYNPVYGADVAIQVSPSGTVTGFLPDAQIHGTYGNGRIEFSGTEFDVEQTASGFNLTQRDDRKNIVVYHRDR
jgi:hypothetical protein